MSALTLGDFKSQMWSANSKALQNALGDEKKALKFFSSMTFCVQKTPKLLECTKESLQQAFLSCAEWELYPSTVSGEAYILPYGKEAQFQLGYQGLVSLMYRAGVSAIYSEVVYKNDKFEFLAGTEQKLIHSPKLDGDRGEAIGCYVVAVVNSNKIFKYMPKGDILKFKEFSKSKGSNFSPWNSNDPEKWMWRKTVLKQLSKLLPKTGEMQIAIEADNRDSDLTKTIDFDISEFKTPKNVNSETGEILTAEGVAEILEK